MFLIAVARMTRISFSVAITIILKNVKIPKVSVTAFTSVPPIKINACSFQFAQSIHNNHSVV